MRKNKLILCVVFSLIISSLTPFLTIYAEESSDVFELTQDGKSAILIEQDTGTILYDKDPHEKLPPASMTKVMTLLLIMEAIETGKIELDESVRISEKAASMGGSQIFLEAGEEMSVNDLLKGVAIASANDASVALAEKISGSVENFVKEMNRKVEELNLENTKFQNTSGLPAENHYSTAYDMAMISQELLKHEQITEYTSIYEDYLRKGKENEFWLVNTNKLVRFYPEVDGLKTGYTSEAQYCLTATAKKDDMRVVAVVLGFDSSKERNQAVSSMLDYAFSQFETTKMYDRGEKITEISTLKGEQQKVDIVTARAVSTIHAKGEEREDITTEITLEDNLSLPIKEGDEIGELTVWYEDEVLTKVPLTVETSLEEASMLTLFKRSFQELVNLK